MNPTVPVTALAPVAEAWHVLSLGTGALLFAVHVAVVLRAITRPGRTPASRVAWVAVIMSLPLAGVLAYALLGETSVGRARTRRLHRVHDTLARPGDAPSPHAVSAAAGGLFELGRSINGYGPVGGNRIELLGDPDATPAEPTRDCDAAIARLVQDIDAARDHVHVGFYIWLDDGNGGRVADALCAAARRGVTCRVMVDALGSRAFRASPRWRAMKDAGVHACATLNDIPRLGHLAVGRIDLRNHRKIAVIDGDVAYCGSQNCADPQFRCKPRFAPWIDMLLRCEGPVARHAQYLFLESWIAETGETGLERMPAAPAAMSAPATGGDVLAQMTGTGPVGGRDAMADLFVAALYAAADELIVTTPYFVPDEALLRAMGAAARRGVATTLIVPARNDSRLVDLACRSTWSELLQAGVQLHEYPLGLLHSKSVTIDGRIALVGSANMDRRSLQLNFENNLVIDDARLTGAVRARQLGYLSVSRPVEAADVAARGFVERLMQNAVGMMAPVL